MRGSTAGLGDGDKFSGLSTKMSYHSIMLETLDDFCASFLVAPLVVSYWRGTWNLMDTFLMPHNKTHSAIASLIIGIIGHLVFTIFQGTFRDNFNPQKHRITFYLGSRLYTCVFAIICVATWRGGWQLIDIYSERDLMTIIYITIPSILLLVALKTIRNISASPFVIVTDHSQEYFDVPTMFKKTVRQHTNTYT